MEARTDAASSPDQRDVTAAAAKGRERRAPALRGDNRLQHVYRITPCEADEERGVNARSATAECDALERLLCASGNGDREAFARVYELTARQLYPIALHLMRRRDAAEDVLQEAYVLVWRKAVQYHPARGRALPWMAAIVRNCAIDRLRARGREPQDTAQWDEAAEAVADPVSVAAAVSAPDTLAVQRCLGRLQENQRRAILLAYYYGMTHEELSARLEVPLGTAKSWVRRGLLHLKDCLGA